VHKRVAAEIERVHLSGEAVLSGEHSLLIARLQRPHEPASAVGATFEAASVCDHLKEHALVPCGAGVLNARVVLARCKVDSREEVDCQA